MSDVPLTCILCVTFSKHYFVQILAARRYTEDMGHDNLCSRGDQCQFLVSSHP